MKSRIATISALAGVLFTGVAAAAVNTQALQGSPGADTQVTEVVDTNLVASSSAYANSGLVTDISAFQLVPAPVIEYQYVNVPGISTPAAPTVKKTAAKKSTSSASGSSSSTSTVSSGSSGDDDDDEDEDEDD